MMTLEKLRAEYHWNGCFHSIPSVPVHESFTDAHGFHWVAPKNGKFILIDQRYPLVDFLNRYSRQLSAGVISGS